MVKILLLMLVSFSCVADGWYADIGIASDVGSFRGERKTYNDLGDGLYAIFESGYSKNKYNLSWLHISSIKENDYGLDLIVFKLRIK